MKQEKLINYLIFKNKDNIKIVCKKVGYQYKYFDFHNGCRVWRKLYPCFAITSIKVLKEELSALGFDFQKIYKAPSYIL